MNTATHQEPRLQDSLENLLESADLMAISNAAAEHVADLIAYYLDLTGWTWDEETLKLKHAALMLLSDAIGARLALLKVLPEDLLDRLHTHPGLEQTLGLKDHVIVDQDAYLALLAYHRDPRSGNPAEPSSRPEIASFIPPIRAGRRADRPAPVPSAEEIGA